MSTRDDSAAVEALYATGHWLLDAGRHADAVIVFRAMTLAAPTDERAWLGLGASHEAAGDYAIAGALYVLATQAASPAIRCTIARARLLRHLGADEAATLALEEAAGSARDADDDELLDFIARESAEAA